MSEANINVTPSGTPPAAAGNPNPTPAPAGNWYDSFDPDTKGYIQNKGFKDPSDVVQSYRNFEKLLGKRESLITLPEKEDAPEWNAVYEKLGRPKEAKEYAIEGEMADWAKETFHKLGLSKKQAENLYQEWNGKTSALNEAKTQEYNQKLESEVKGLEKEWGSAYQQNVTIAKRAAARFNMTGETIDALEQAMGHSKTMNFLKELGSGLGEAQFVTSNQNGGFVHTPDSAKNKISMLKNDPAWVQKYVSGDVGAREEFERLHKQAFGE